MRAEATSWSRGWADWSSAEGMSEKPDPARTWTSPPSWSVATSIGVAWVVPGPTLEVKELMTFWVAWLPAVVRPAMKMLPTWWVSTASLEDCLGAWASTPTIMSWPTFSSRLQPASGPSVAVAVAAADGDALAAAVGEGAAVDAAGSGALGFALGEEEPADEEPGMREHPARDPAPTRAARSTGRRLMWCCGDVLGSAGAGVSPASGAAGRRRSFMPATLRQVPGCSRGNDPDGLFTHCARCYSQPSSWRRSSGMPKW